MRHLSVVLAATSLAGVLCAQPALVRFDGPAPGDFAGRSVAVVGDVDGDGTTDLLVGADGVDGNSTDEGHAFLISGATGLVLRTFVGDSIGDFFGASVAGAGDVDGDGVPDLVIGAYGDDPGDLLDSGSAVVISGATGTVLWKFLGATLEERVGWAVAGAGDVDADGHDDVIVGAYSASPNGMTAAGQVVVWSGRTGQAIWTFDGHAPSEFFGFAVDGAGDVDFDGHADVIVGAPGAAGQGQLSGAAYVYSGRTGQQLHALAGPESFSFYGVSVALVGDVDDDLHADIAVGAPAAHAPPLQTVGAVFVYSGRQGNQLARIDGSASNTIFGFALAGAGDVDGDGRDEFLIGSLVDSTFTGAAGAAFVYGIDAVGNPRLVKGFGGTTPAEAFGYDVAGRGDFDGDGFPDVLVGAPFADPATGIEAGTAVVLDVGSSGTPARAEVFGTACRGSNGALPHVDWRGEAKLGEDLAVLLRGGLVGSAATLNLSRPNNLPLDPFGMTGCTAYTTHDGFVSTHAVQGTNGFGTARTAVLTVPMDPALVGASIVGQWFVMDAAANPAGYTASNAARFTFGQ